MAKEMQKKAEQAISTERKSFIPEGDRTGTEQITADELRLPRLSIAQALSPQILEGNPAYIEGLKIGVMFNDLSEEIYGKGPITFIPIRRDIRRIEFKPRSEGGGVVRMDVPANDKAMQWTTENGIKKPPKATKFVEFVIQMLLPEQPPQAIVLSIKGTNKWNRRAEERLTGFIKLKDKPIFAGLYTVATMLQSNDKGTFGVFSINQAGLLDDPKVDDATWELHQKLYNNARDFELSLRGKNIVTEREPGDEDDFVESEVVNRPEM